MEYLPYFDDLNLCLKFIEQVEPEQRRRHILSLYTNQLIHKHCVIEKDNKGVILKFKKTGEIYQDVKNKDKILLDVINVAFEYLSSSQVLHIKDYRESLTNNKYLQAKLGKSDKNIFPFNMIKDNKLTTNFLLGLANGIFILSSKKGIYKDNSGISKRAFTFEKNIQNYPNHSTFNNTINVKKKKTSKEFSEIKLTKILNSATTINEKIKL